MRNKYYITPRIEFFIEENEELLQTPSHVDADITNGADDSKHDGNTPEQGDQSNVPDEAKRGFDFDFTLDQ